MNQQTLYYLARWSIISAAVFAMRHEAAAQVCGDHGQTEAQPHFTDTGAPVENYSANIGDNLTLYGENFCHDGQCDEGGSIMVRLPNGILTEAVATVPRFCGDRHDPLNFLWQSQSYGVPPMGVGQSFFEPELGCWMAEVSWWWTCVPFVRNFVFQVRTSATDCNYDWTTDGADLLIVLQRWGVKASNIDIADINHDYRVDIDDLLAVLEHWTQ